MKSLEEGLFIVDCGFRTHYIIKTNADKVHGIVKRENPPGINPGGFKAVTVSYFTTISFFVALRSPAIRR